MQLKVVREPVGRAQTISVRLEPEQSSCPSCMETMRVQKTRKKRFITIKFGNVNASLVSLQCRYGCTTSSGKRIVTQPSGLASIVPPGCTFGYDIEVFVGKERYLRHAQRTEIQQKLRQIHGISISLGEISSLAKRFVEHIQLLHFSKCTDLRVLLDQDGGCPLHLDATGENGSGTVLVIYAGWRPWVLGSWKISTECSDQIKPRLHEIARQFGLPCAIVRDLSRAMTLSCNEFVAESKAKIPILACHFHFVKDIGKDLLSESYESLRSLNRKYSIKSSLRSMVRNLNKYTSDEYSDSQIEVEKWAKADDYKTLPSGSHGLAVVRALGQWSLDYSAGSKNYRFPFELPYHDFYLRCRSVRRACNVYMHQHDLDKPVRKALKKLARIVDPVMKDPEFAAQSAILMFRATLFEELRAVLRIKPKINQELSSIQKKKEDAAAVRDIARGLRLFTRSLKRRYPKRGPAQCRRRAFDIILKHIKLHGKYLSGHIIKKPAALGGGVGVVPRTNNTLENFFGTVKQGERRRSGRKVLTKDFEDLPASALLTYNLNCPEYVKIVCGDIENLPRLFSELDQQKSLAKTDIRSTGSIINTASLSRADRNFIRRIDLGSKIQEASASRASQVPLH